MKVIRGGKNSCVLIFETGENYPSAFVKFLGKKKIGGGFFTGLGALNGPEIAFYDLKKRKYLKKRFRGDFEVLNLTGNIARSGGKTAIHQHVTLGKRNFAAFGGHLTDARVGGTLEIFLTVLPGMKRAKNTATGLNLLAP